MICREHLSSFQNIALAMSVLAAFSACALGQTVATPYLVTAPQTSGKSAAPATFVSAPAFRVSEIPSSAIATDMNGDGKPDLVVASAVSGEITVYLGTGQGKFTNPAVYSVGGHPVAIASADLRGSGRQDIVTANGSDGTVSVLFGMGDGKLGPVRIYSAGVSADLLSVGSLRGDGKQDVAIASTAGRKLAVLLNDGRGVLSGGIGQSLPRPPTSLTIARLRASGQADLALANGDGTVSVLLGRGDGSFNTPVLLSVSSTTLSSIVAGDFDRDGKTDLAVAQTDAHLLTLLHGNGDGSFVLGASYAVGNDPVSASALDANGDGILDLVTVNRGSNTFSVLLGNGDGSLEKAVDSTVGDGPVALASGDFYGRGFTGLAVVNAAAKTVSVVDGNGDGSFKAAPSYSGDLSPRSIASGDLNGDGKSDLVVTNFCGTDATCSKGGTISVYLAKASGGYSLGSRYPVGAGPVSVLLEDLNRDENLDAVILNRTDKTVSILLGAGDGTFGEPRTLSLADAPATFAIGDFNKDGNPDLAIATDCGSAKCSQPGSLQILFGAGNGSFTPGRTYPLGYSPNSIAVGDIRQTGILDILVANKCGDDSTCASAGTATVLAGDGKGNFTRQPDLAIGNSPSSLALESLSGNKILDLVVSRESDNAISVLKGSGDGSFAAPVSYAVGSAPRSVVIADFSGSGTKSIAVANFKDSTVSLLLGRGNGTLAPAVAYSVAAGPESVTAVVGKSGSVTSIVTANGNSGSSTPGFGITELVHPLTSPSFPLATITTLTGTYPQAVYGAQITFSAMVTSSPLNGSSYPGGDISVLDGTNKVCDITTLTPQPGNAPPGSSSGTVTGSCSTSTPLTGGSHSITATYNSQDTQIYQNSTTLTATNQMITTFAPSVTLTATATATFGQPVTLTATVSGVAGASSAAPTGSVTFTDAASGTLLGGASACGQLVQIPTTNNSQATCTSSTLPVNSYNFIATYNPATDPNYSTGSPSMMSPVTVGKITPSVTISSSLSSVVVNQQVTFTSAFTGVTSPPPSGGTFTFVATLNGQPTTLCSGISSPSCSTSSLHAGSYSVTAQYVVNGNADIHYGTSLVSSPAASLTVNPGAITMTLLPAQSTTTVNAPTALTATVSQSAPTSGPPLTSSLPVTGSLAFTNGSSTTPLCPAFSVTATSPSTTCNAALPLGSNTVTATFTNSAGDFSTSAATATEQVNKANSIISIVTTGNNVTQVDQGAVFTATVVGNPAGTVLPSGGTTTFSSEAGALPECVGLSINTAGTAVCTTYSLSAAIHTITAAYSGDSSFIASTPSKTASSVSQTVTRSPVTVALPSFSPSTIIATQVVTASSVVNPLLTAGTPSAGYAVKMTGNVTFTITEANGTILSPCVAPIAIAVSSAAALCPTIAFPSIAGSSTFTVTATYGGDGNFQPNTSTVATANVQDFSLAPPPTNIPSDSGPSGSAAPTNLYVTQGYAVGTGTANTDPFFTIAPTATVKSMNAFAGTVTFTSCGPTAGPGPACSVSLTPAPPTVVAPATVPLTISAGSPALPTAAGDYPFTLVGADQGSPFSPQTALIHSTAFTVTVVPITQNGSISVLAEETATAQFSVATPSDTFTFACVVAIDQNGIKTTYPLLAADTNGLYCNPTSSTGHLVAATDGTFSTTFTLGNQYTVSSQADSRSGQPKTVFFAATFLGVPFFVWIGWVGRKRFGARAALRLLGVAAIAGIMSQTLGCGGNGFTVPSPSQSAATSAFTPGTYLVRVTATDQTTNVTYYSTIQFTAR